MTPRMEATESVALGDAAVVAIDHSQYVRVPTGMAESCTPLDVAIWAAIRMAGKRGWAGTVEWLVRDRLHLEPTRDRIKKTRQRIRRLVAEGWLHEESLESGRVWWVTLPTQQALEDRRGAEPTRGWWWLGTISRDNLARAADPADPVTHADLVAWVRWQQLLRRNQVRVTQKDLAARWGVTDRQVRLEKERLIRAGWLESDPDPGNPISYRPATGAPDGLRDVGAGVARWRTERGPLADAADDNGEDVSEAFDADGRSEEVALTEAVDAAQTTPEVSCTPSGSFLHHAASDTPPSTRARALTNPLAPVGTSVPKAQLGRERGVEGGVTAASQKRDHSRQAKRQAYRIVYSQPWLTAAPDKVQHQCAAILAGTLRRQIMSFDELTAAVAMADTGDATIDHARQIRAAIAGVVADTKAAAGHPTADTVGQNTTDMDAPAAARWLLACPTRLLGTLDALGPVMALIDAGQPPVMPTDKDAATTWLAAQVFAAAGTTDDPITAIADIATQLEALDLDQELHTTLHELVSRATQHWTSADTADSTDPESSDSGDGDSAVESIGDTMAPQAPGAGTDGGELVELAVHTWSTEPLPAEPSWATTTEAVAAEWLARLCLHRPKLPVAALVSRLPEQWHALAYTVHLRVRLARSGRGVTLGVLASTEAAA